MPKGKKTCPKCGLETGARARDCQCGHQFSSPAKVEQNSAPAPTPTPTPTPTPIVAQETKSVKSSLQFPPVYAAAGKCPITPEGYKKGWPDGPASEETVVSWIHNVLNSSKKNYTPNAIVYWSGQFWDINGPNCGEDHKRVRSIIINTLGPLC
jgi:hypothetical protein